MQEGSDLLPAKEKRADAIRSARRISLAVSFSARNYSASA